MRKRTILFRKLLHIIRYNSLAIFKATNRQRDIQINGRNPLKQRLKRKREMTSLV